MRMVLNVIVDILTLLVIAIAGVGHMLPWFNAHYTRLGPIAHWDKFEEKKGNAVIDRQEKARLEEEARRERTVALMEFQAWHAMRSGAALGALCVLVFLSLAFSWGPFLRRLLVLSMFLCALAAVAIISLSFSWYPITEEHRLFAGTLREDAGFFVALIPSCFALAFCLIRMIWTMPPVRVAPAAVTLVAHPAESRPPDDANNPGLFRPRE